jgi:hypothetical protein
MAHSLLYMLHVCQSDEPKQIAVIEQLHFNPRRRYRQAYLRARSPGTPGIHGGPQGE